MLRTIHNRPTPLSRLTALLAIGLVLALAVLASSPELHERLHCHHGSVAGASHRDAIPDHGAKADSEDGCVVTLFAQGLVMALPIVALALTGQTILSEIFALFDRVIPEAPRYLHLPTQAPPLA